MALRGEARQHHGRDLEDALVEHGRVDTDGDGDSDGRDFLAWQQQFSGDTVAAAAVAVPEPTSVWLLASMLLGVVRRRV